MNGDEQPTWIESLASPLLEKKVSRRRFIFDLTKAIFVGSAIGTLGGLGYSVWNVAGPLVTGKVSGLRRISSEVPGSLKNVELPSLNEHFRDADEIFSEGLELYKHWRANNKSLPELYYEKPPNFIEVSDALSTYQDVLKERGLETISPEIISYLLGYLNDSARALDVPYYSFLNGSGSNISGLESLVGNDGGSGIVNCMREKFIDFAVNEKDLYTALKSGNVSQRERLKLCDIFKDWFGEALAYVRTARQNKGTEISTSVLFAYFLHKNNGNIYAAMWDTVTWLKVAARNNPQDLSYDPTYDKAALLASIFVDEFSPEISTNWVVDHTSQHDQTLNYVGDNYAYPKLKDFMPANRAGGFYHG